MTSVSQRRSDEVVEGVRAVIDELDVWVASVDLASPEGVHVTQLAAVVDILEPVLITSRDEAAALAGEEPNVAYRRGLAIDKRVAACIRLFRWYTLRFGQREQEGLGSCLRGADEVVWSAWKRTFDAARVGDIPPAPLSYIDSEPIPSASLHQSLPAEVKPPYGDSLFTQRLKALPVPVIGLPPLAARRPWWLITALHECAHHVHQHFYDGAALASALSAAAACEGADKGEATQWGDWAAECFADAFGVAFGGEPSVWAVEELERPVANRQAARPTYPSADVRVHLVHALVAETKGEPLQPEGDGPGGRVPVMAKVLMDLPIGATTLRAAGDGGAELAKEQRSWKKALVDGSAQPEKTIEAAAHVIGAAVMAWRDGALEVSTLRAEVLRVLPGCRPVGTRKAASEPDLEAASRALLAGLENENENENENEDEEEDE